jgi:hypothetical protein
MLTPSTQRADDGEKKMIGVPTGGRPNAEAEPRPKTSIKVGTPRALNDQS